MSRIAAALLVALALGGCGGDDDEASPPPTTPAKPPQRAAAAIEVSETEYRLDPSHPKVRAGTVAFRVRNDGKTVHALEIEGPEGEVETPPIEPGGSARLEARLTKPGRYEWYCPVGGHRGLGMRGRIAVTGRGSAGGSDRSGARSQGGGGSGPDRGLDGAGPSTDGHGSGY